MARLRNDIVDDVSMDFGRSEIATLMAIREPFVVDSKQMKTRRVEIMDMHGVLNHRIQIDRYPRRSVPFSIHHRPSLC